MKTSMLGQLAIAVAVLVLAASVWFSAPRYAFTLADGLMRRGDVRRGSIEFCRIAADRYSPNNPFAPKDSTKRHFVCSPTLE